MEKCESLKCKYIRYHARGTMERGWRLHLVSGLLLSRHFQMRDGVCIERNEYHVNTSYIYRFRLHIEYVLLSFLLYVAFTSCCLELGIGFIDPYLGRLKIRCTGTSR